MNDTKSGKSKAAQLEELLVTIHELAQPFELLAQTMGGGSSSGDLEAQTWLYAFSVLSGYAVQGVKEQGVDLATVDAIIQRGARAGGALFHMEK